MSAPAALRNLSLADRQHRSTLQVASELRLLHRLAIAYLLLPLGVWLVGWFEWWFGVPAVVLLCAGFGRALGGSWMSRPSTASLVAMALAFCWVMATAAGGIFDLENGDWHEHRTTMLDLGRYPWPTYLPDHFAAYLPRSDAGPTLLRYYLGWYMVPGLAAHWFGPAALNWAVPLWNWAGVALVLALFARHCCGWKAAVSIAILIFFGGMDILRVLALSSWDWLPPIIEGEAGRDVFHWWRRAQRFMGLESPMTSVMWVPQHTIPAGLYALLCMQLRRQPRFLAVSGVLLAAAPFWSAFVAVGLLPFVAVLLRENGLRPFLRWPNLLLAGPLVGLVALYLTSGALDFAHGWIWEVLGWRDAAVKLIVLYVTEFLLLALLLCVVRPELRRDPFFVASVATLLIMPLFIYGHVNDLLRRGALPALIVLAWFCARTVVLRGPSIVWQGGRRRLAFAALAAVLAMGILAPLTELARAFQRSGAFRYEQVGYTTLVDLPAMWRRQNVAQDIPPALRLLLRDPGSSAPRTARGELLSRSVFDIYLDDGRLIYVKDSCTPSELEQWFFVRLVPRNMDDLPAYRARGGFDRGFGYRPALVGGKCVSAVSLPTYPIARLVTGQRIRGQASWTVELVLD